MDQRPFLQKEFNLKLFIYTKLMVSWSLPQIDPLEIESFVVEGINS